jgi:DNA polymerase V
MKNQRQRLYGLLDCNSFFASCEKLFRPDLRDKPVVVLSNNDGVVVARSPEAKLLGIPMGEAYYKIKHLAERNRVIVFSSNYRLYGDMSNRVMKTLQRWTPNIEIYSIDEAFLDFTGLDIGNSVDAFLHEVTATVKKWTGIPVSLGLAPTMTLAKVANDVAKKRGGTCSLIDPEARALALADLAIGDVWGIGRRLAPKMSRLGIRTAKDLAAIDPAWVRKNFTIVQEQLVRELNGECCLDMATVPAPRKNIQVSRSFPAATDDYRQIAEAVSSFAARACEKARSEGTVASAVYVHLNTSWYKRDNSYVSEGKTWGLTFPTSSTPEIIRTALGLLREVYRDGLPYKKASVMLLDLQNVAAVKSQGILFDPDDRNPNDRDRDDRLMGSVDQINRALGRGTLFFGSQGIERQWRGASNHCSPNYTLHFADLPVAKAK